MIARVGAVLRRSEGVLQNRNLCIGGIGLNPESHTVTVNGEKALLTLKEFELLAKFMDNPGLVFTRDQLLHSVWGSDFIGETRTVDVHIGTLRTKLGSCGDYIETVRGVGYRMEAPL